ncbi:GL12352 [Drosophila persimilis]|uniref:GL12352 n=1 Tax=Drosophila persimilis TaxID=7234 RepID=B4GMA0_DROPE|nr:GL12352 [Drosophila persimilis]
MRYDHTDHTVFFEADGLALGVSSGIAVVSVESSLLWGFFEADGLSLGVSSCVAVVSVESSLLWVFFEAEGLALGVSSGVAVVSVVALLMSPEQQRFDGDDCDTAGRTQGQSVCLEYPPEYPYFDDAARPPLARPLTIRVPLRWST